MRAKVLTSHFNSGKAITIMRARIKRAINIALKF